jgi:hypothetical protein
LAGLAMAQPLFSVETNSVAAKPQLPSELESFLKNADEFTLFSLNPDPDFEHKSTKRLSKWQKHLACQLRIYCGQAIEIPL